MCGINGYIDFDLSPDHGKHLVNKMNSHLVHRGPDGKGTFIDGNIGLGHTRLSIIDLSVSANQPMTSLSKRSTLSFNGEIYNFINIKNELSKSYNISFNTSSDTEVLLNLLEYQGVDRALDQIEGMFAFAFNDSKTQCLYLARDRFGEKPLFYYLKNNKLYFSSELKPLMSVLKDSLTINYKNLDFFLKKSYLPIDESIFNEIRKVKPGQYLKIGYSDNVLSVSEHCYWDYGKLVIDSLQTKKESDFLFHKEQLKDLLKDKVNQAMISDVPLGAFLSGGYDSTCMVALMQSAKMNAVKTFSIGFDDKDFDEAPFAKAIANHIGTDHEELYVSRADLLDLIPKLPEIYSEPFADSSQIPTVLLSRLTRSHVTVSISGDGGDEIFGGYGRYVLGERVKSFFNYLPLHLRNFIKSTNSIDLLKPFLSIMLSNKVSNFENKVIKLKAIIDAKDDQELFQRLSNFNNNFSKELYKEHRKNIWNHSCSYSRKAMTDDSIDYLPGDILQKVDMAGMSCSLETRIPLLNHKVAEYALSIPHDFLISNGQGKKILKDIVHDFVPKDLMERPKRGFEVPLNSYLRNELRDYSEAMIDYGKDKFIDHLNFDEINFTWDSHLNRRFNQPHLLWNLVSFFAWHKQHAQ